MSNKVTPAGGQRQQFPPQGQQIGALLQQLAQGSQQGGGFVLNLKTRSIEQKAAGPPASSTTQPQRSRKRRQNRGDAAEVEDRKAVVVEERPATEVEERSAEEGELDSSGSGGEGGILNAGGGASPASHGGSSVLDEPERQEGTPEAEDDMAAEDDEEDEQEESEEEDEGDEEEAAGQVEEEAEVEVEEEDEAQEEDVLESQEVLPPNPSPARKRRRRRRDPERPRARNMLSGFVADSHMARDVGASVLPAVSSREMGRSKARTAKSTFANNKDAGSSSEGELALDRITLRQDNVRSADLRSRQEARNSQDKRDPRLRLVDQERQPRAILVPSRRQQASEPMAASSTGRGLGHKGTPLLRSSEGVAVAAEDPTHDSKRLSKRDRRGKGRAHHAMPSDPPPRAHRGKSKSRKHRKRRKDDDVEDPPLHRDEKARPYGNEVGVGNRSQPSTQVFGSADISKPSQSRNEKTEKSDRAEKKGKKDKKSKREKKGDKMEAQRVGEEMLARVVNVAMESAATANKATLQQATSSKRKGEERDRRRRRSAAQEVATDATQQSQRSHKSVVAPDLAAFWAGTPKSVDAFWGSVPGKPGAERLATVTQSASASSQRSVLPPSNSSVPSDLATPPGTWVGRPGNSALASAKSPFDAPPAATPVQADPHASVAPAPQTSMVSSQSGLASLAPASLAPTGQGTKVVNHAKKPRRKRQESSSSGSSSSSSSDSEESTSSRSHSKRRKRKIVPPEAWQVWPGPQPSPPWSSGNHPHHVGGPPPQHGATSLPSTTGRAGDAGPAADPSGASAVVAQSGPPESAVEILRAPTNPLAKGNGSCQQSAGMALPASSSGLVLPARPSLAMTSSDDAATQHGMSSVPGSSVGLAPATDESRTEVRPMKLAIATGVVSLPPSLRKALSASTQETAAEAAPACSQPSPVLSSPPADPGSPPTSGTANREPVALSADAVPEAGLFDESATEGEEEEEAMVTTDIYMLASTGEQDEEETPEVQRPRRLHPSAAAWPGPARTPWRSPRPLLGVTLVGPAPAGDITAARRARAAAEAAAASAATAAAQGEDDSGNEEVPEMAGLNVNDHLLSDSDSETAAQGKSEDRATQIQDLPLWGRLLQWPGALIALHVDPEVTRQSGRVTSLELRGRAAARSIAGAGSTRASPLEPPGSTPSQGPVSQTTDLAQGVMGALAASELAAQNRFQTIPWRRPLALALPECAVYDASRYDGTERASRALARRALSAEPLFGASVLGATAPDSPPAAATPAASADDYTTKLIAMMNRLQSEAIPAGEAVRGLWASLPVPDRLRFSSEFPQFMHYVVGL